MSTKTNAEYPCSTKDLYTVSRIGWLNFKKFEIEFKKIKGFYTTEFANDALAQVETAACTPEPLNIYNEDEHNRIMLEVKSEVCKKNFVKLKMYINKAYQDEMQIIIHEQAGLAHYKEATNQNWYALNEMNTCMESFMSSHLEKLKANTNMPSSFESMANTGIYEFSIAYEKYLNDINKKTADNYKCRADNHLFRKLSVMFKDAQILFKRYPELASLFDLNKILQSVNASTAKIKGLVTDESDLVIATAIIKIKYPDEAEIVLVVDEDGSYDTGSIKGGLALITAEAEGFAQVIETLNIPKGAIISKNLRLMRAA